VEALLNLVTATSSGRLHPPCGPTPVRGTPNSTTQKGWGRTPDCSVRNPAGAGGKVDAGVRPGPARRRRPQRHSRRGAPARSWQWGCRGLRGGSCCCGPEKCFQLDCTAGHPGGHREPVPIHDSMGAASLPARAPAGWAGGDLVDQRSAIR